jgi:hypothetical protein
MSDSVYATLCKDQTNPEVATTVMFLKRSNGEWWLPGGKILPQHSNSREAVRWWVEKLTPLEDWSPNEIGMWHLSPEAGGHQVRLFEGDYLGQGFMKSRWTSTPLSCAVGWFTTHGISTHLYRHGDMPWGQAKMAMYRIKQHQFGKCRANGQQLKDGLGWIDGQDWSRPGSTPDLQ